MIKIKEAKRDKLTNESLSLNEIAIEEWGKLIIIWKVIIIWILKGVQSQHRSIDLNPWVYVLMQHSIVDARVKENRPFNLTPILSTILD
jgi:hypothetical protein